MQVDSPERRVIFKPDGGIVVVTGKKKTHRKTHLGNRGNEAFKLLTKQEREWKLERGIPIRYGNR